MERINDIDFVRECKLLELSFYDPFHIGKDLYYKFTNKNNEVRYYTPQNYLELRLDTHLVDCDKSSNKASCYKMILVVKDETIRRVNEIVEYYHYHLPPHIIVKGALSGIAKAVKDGREALYKKVIERHQFNRLFEKIEIKLERLKTEAMYPKKIAKPTKFPLTSFESNLTDPQLKTLFKELINNKFIHSKSGFEQFKAIFKAKPIKIITPMKWLKDKPQLFYFLNELIDRNKLIQPESVYKNIEACFVDKKGQPFKNLKQSYHTYKNITDNCRDIDEITEILTSVFSI